MRSGASAPYVLYYKLILRFQSSRKKIIVFPAPLHIVRILLTADTKSRENLDRGVPENVKDDESVNITRTAVY